MLQTEWYLGDQPPPQPKPPGDWKEPRKPKDDEDQEDKEQ